MKGRLPDEIGGYHVLALLGSGGMGTVYRAVDGDGRTVALKVLHPHLAGDPDARERLRREVRNLQRVRHPAVARVLDAEIDADEAFVVTELVEGSDLGAYVRRRGPLPAAELAVLADRLREALAEVHRAGVLHRDLTPGNVMITEGGPVVIDFGIAQAAEDARVTSTGFVAGTPGYLAPELLEGGHPTEAADWWGWAALLALAATGRPPFGSGTVAAVLTRARGGLPDLEGLGRRTAAALRSALAADPWRRTPPEDVVAELQDVAAHGDEEALTGVMDAADGSTRVFPPPPAPAATAPTAVAPWAQRPPPPESEEWPDLHPYDDHVGDVDAGVVPARRPGSLVALAVLLVALGAARPGVALTGAAVAAVLARSVGLGAEALRQRLLRRGPRRGDALGVVLAWPWYLLRAAVGVLPAAFLAASAVVAVGGVAWWLLDGRVVLVPPDDGAAAGALDGNAVVVVHLLLGAVVALGLLALWFGPAARTTRVGARWALGALAPGRTGAAALVLLALAVAAVLAYLAVGRGVVWWPLPGPPELGIPQRG